MNELVRPKKIRIRAYRAVDEPESCEKYALGHEEVLKEFNIYVTSANKKWFSNPSVFVISVESESGQEVFGGARIQIATHEERLPIEDAIGKKDPKIYDMVNENIDFGVGELCGLWNSRKVKGMGFSELLTKACVARASVVIAGRLNLKKLFVLCGEHTVHMVKAVGFSTTISLGDYGKFPYPKPDLRATVLNLDHFEDLPFASPRQRADIFDLRENPRQIRTEIGPLGQVQVEYDLLIENLSLVV